MPIKLIRREECSIYIPDHAGNPTSSGTFEAEYIDSLICEIAQGRGFLNCVGCEHNKEMKNGIQFLSI